MHRLIFSLVVVMALGCLAGCPGLPRGQVVKDYTQAMREEQVIPVFPPREDIQVGDIFLLAYGTREDELKAYKARGYLDIDMLLHSLDCSEKLKVHYAKRFEFPKSPPPPAEGAIAAEAIGTGNVFDGVKSEGRMNRLPHVGFPEFTYAAATAAEARAMAPIHGFPVKLAGAYAEVESASLKMRASESYGLPLTTIDNHFRTDMLDENGRLKDEGLKKLWPKDHYGRLIVEAFLTREIEITTNFKRALGASAGVGAGDPTTTTPTVEDIKKSMQEANKILKDQSGAGGFFQITGMTESQITMKRTFPRPIVIGVRILDYKCGDNNKVDRRPPGERGPDLGVRGGVKIGHGE